MAIVYGSKHSGKTKLWLGVEGIIKQLRKNRKYATVKKDTKCPELSKYISAITEGRVTVMIGAFDAVNAYAMIPMLDNSNPLIMDSMTRATEGIDTDIKYTSFKRKYPDMIGGFNFEENKFTGWAKDIKYTLCLGYRCIYPSKNDADMNSEVATFISAHEFGHLVEKILGTGTLLRESYILGQSHARLMKVTDTDKRIKIIGDILSEEGIKASSDISATIDDDATLYPVIIGKTRGTIRSELDSYGYDQTGSESLADYYAVKQGYGIGALYLTKDSSSGLEVDDIHYIVSWAISGSLAGILTASLGAMGGVMLAGIAYSAFAGYSYDTHSARYDDSADRLERILNGYIENIKTSNLPVSNQELIEVKRMLKVLDGLPKDGRGVIQSVFEYVNPKGRHERNARDLQKDLESLSNHRLAIKAKEYTR